MSQPEHNIQNAIRMAIKPSEARLFRNNVGTAWTGDVSKLRDGSILIRNPRPFHAGLCEGSGDLIGWRITEITPAMVGTKIAVFTSVEVKTPKGRPSKAQLAWHSRIVEDGGLSVIARSPQDARQGLALDVC